MTERLCIIPARKGSKRLPGKNKRLLAGKPLILHTLDVVAPLFDTVVFSSDCEEMLDIAEKVHNVDIFRRPSYLASDTSKVLETVIEIHRLTPRHDEIWLCLPTCPLRCAEDVIAAQGLLMAEDVDAVVSVTDFDFPPDLSLEICEDGSLRERHPSRPFSSGNTRSQDFTPVYRPNGAVYGAKWDSFSKYQNFFRGRVLAHYMPRSRSLDVDTLLDFRMVEVALERT